MKKILLPGAVALITIIICCKTPPRHYLIGKWNMAVDQQVMIFNADSTMLWAFNDKVVGDTFKLKYKLDESKSPHQIDLYDFNMGILKGKILVGILDHFSPDSILLDFEPIEQWAQADSVRPKDFNIENKRVLSKIR